MIGNIRSEFFLKYLFSHVKEKKVLQLVNHNKSLQLKLEKGLINYKLSSNKYTIYEKNGYRKIYNGFDNELIFEGEYLNGKKNGKGKEYYKNGNLKFEGEYLDDKKWSGKLYDKNNNIFYKLNEGKGHIKEDNPNFDYNEIIFEGEYINGERNGKGKEYDDIGLIFEGEYINGKRLL